MKTNSDFIRDFYTKKPVTYMTYVLVKHSICLKQIQHVMVRISWFFAKVCHGTASVKINHSLTEFKNKLKQLENFHCSYTVYR